MTLQPRTKANVVAGMLAAFAVSGFFDANGEPLAVIATVSGALVAIAASLFFRWPFARIAALVPMALTAVLAILTVTYNAIMLFVYRPPTSGQIGALILSVVIGIATTLSVRWLDSAQAKAYFSRAALIGIER
jgi:membrane associated rhomboid family serine protease